uniref:Inositol 1,4,5-trisphosphate receptor n=1 Tax=Lygus hesperus TaxID=30085 RepID=A0A0A9XXU3_LYGHE
MGEKTSAESTHSWNSIISYASDDDNTYRPQIRWDSPLNLSILVSGGKETNQDSLSSCERTGKSPAPNPGGLAFREMWCSGGFAYLIPPHCVQVHLERGHGPERVPGP